MAKDITIKTTLTIIGDKAQRIRRLKEILGFNTDADILGHLVNQGLSKEAANFAAVETAKKMQADMLETFRHSFREMGEQLKIELHDE